MDLTRRDFARLSAAALSSGSLLTAQKRIPIALELYSIREECKKDWPGSLAAVAKMGYEGVEFAGYNGWSAKDLKKLIADDGLQASSAHVGYKLMSEDLEKTLEYHQELGINRLIIPGFRSENLDGWRRFAGELTELAGKLKERGMAVGYHNHTHELQPLEGSRPWEIVFDNTPKEVIHQADIGHMLRAGADPVKYIKKYAGRTINPHMKDFAPNNEDVMLGEGQMDWKQVIQACRQVGGTKWYVIEQERYPHPPLKCVEICLKNLKELLEKA